MKHRHCRNSDRKRGFFWVLGFEIKPLGFTAGERRTWSLAEITDTPDSWSRFSKLTSFLKHISVHDITGDSLSSYHWSKVLGYRWRFINEHRLIRLSALARVYSVFFSKHDRKEERFSGNFGFSLKTPEQKTSRGLEPLHGCKRHWSARSRASSGLGERLVGAGAR